MQRWDDGQEWPAPDQVAEGREHEDVKWPPAAAFDSAWPAVAEPQYQLNIVEQGSADHLVGIAEAAA